MYVYFLSIISANISCQLIYETPSKSGNCSHDKVCIVGSSCHPYLPEASKWYFYVIRVHIMNTKQRNGLFRRDEQTFMQCLQKSLHICSAVRCLTLQWRVFMHVAKWVVGMSRNKERRRNFLIPLMKPMGTTIFCLILCLPPRHNVVSVSLQR